MTFDMSEDSVDRLAFELWRDLPELDTSAVQRRVNSREHLYAFTDFQFRSLDPRWLVENQFEEKVGYALRVPSYFQDGKTLPDSMASLLYCCIENINQHAGFFTSDDSPMGLFPHPGSPKSLVLAHDSAESLILYVMDCGRGFGNWTNSLLEA